MWVGHILLLLLGIHLVQPLLNQVDTIVNTMWVLYYACMDNHVGIQYKLRLPPEIKEKIAESAKAHNRSMNADIVARLQQSLGQRSLIFSKDFESLIPFLEPLLKEVAKTNQRSLEDEVADRIFKSFTVHGAEEALANASTEDLFKELTRRLQ